MFIGQGDKMEETKFETVGLRSFTDPVEEDNAYYIKNVSAESIRGADWEYSKIYTKSLMEGIPTVAEMTDILMKRGVIGPEFEERAIELATILSNKISDLNNVEDMLAKQTLAIDVAEARDELFQWNQRLNAPLGNTCEHIADDARLEFLTASLVADTEGNRVWEDLDAYLREPNQGLGQRSRYEVMLFLQGVEPDFLEKTPEATALREVGEELTATILEKEAEELLEAEAAEKAAKKATAKPRAKKAPAKPRAKKAPAKTRAKKAAPKTKA